MMARVALVLPALVMVAACGDSLESRNEAAGLDPNAGPSEMTVVTQNSSPSRSSGSTSAPTRSPNAQPTSLGFDDEGEDVLEVDAGAETFIDSAQGFDPTPMDDTSGFDPSPMDLMAGE